MEALFDAIAEGLKKFAGEIIGAILLSLALWAFPSLRSLFSRDKILRKDEFKKQPEEESREKIQKELEILRQEEKHLKNLKEELKHNEEILQQIDIQTVEEVKRIADIQRQLENHREEEEYVRAKIQRLEKAEAQKVEEERQKAEIQQQLEAQRQEKERIRAKIQQQNEAIEKAKAQKAKEERCRAEMQQQLEAQRVGELNNERYVKTIIFAIVFMVIAVFTFPALRSLFTEERTKTQRQVHNTNQAKAVNTPRTGIIELSEQERRDFSKFTTHQLYSLAFQNYIPPNDTRIGIKEDNAKAIRYFLAAAERGHREAQFWLGHMYTIGKGVQKNDAEAVKWWEKSASQGLALAQFWLAHKYAKGEGVRKDEQRAIQLWRQASKEIPEASEEIRKLQKRGWFLNRI